MERQTEIACVFECRHNTLQLLHFPHMITLQFSINLLSQKVGLVIQYHGVFLQSQNTVSES